MSELEKIWEKRYLREREKNKLLEKFIEHKSLELFNAKEKLQNELSDKNSIFNELVLIITKYDKSSSSLDENKFHNKSHSYLIDQLQNIISELKIAKQKAETAMETRARFLANMSHEIRTPMNGIMGLAKLMQGTSLNEKQREYITAITNSSDTLLAIINDILDISKVDAGKMTIDFKDFEIVHLLKSVQNVFEGKAVEKGIALKLEYDEMLENKLLRGDSVRLNQVLYNLVGNAVKFTTEGEVSICAYITNISDFAVEIEFKVKDTGIGIPKEKLDSIFDAFVQVHDESTRQFGGTGLGLAIAKKLVELQHGTLNVNSEINKGSEFKFKLDFPYTLQQVEHTVAQPLIQPNSLLFLNILLVEDNPVNQLLAKDILEAKNFKVTIANNGKEALDIYEKEKFDVILMDMQMPIMDGYEAMKHIRKDFSEEKCTVPILALTAHVIEGEIEKCRLAGASDYLSKPYQPDDLYQKIYALSGSKTEFKETKTIVMETTNIFNADRLLKAVGGSKTLASKIKNLMITEFPKDIENIEAALGAKEWEKLGSLAHRIKPNIQMSTNDELYSFVLALEKDGKSSLNTETFNERVYKLKQDVLLLVNEMKSDQSY